MHELEEHPYILALGAFLVTLVILGIIVLARTSTPQGSASSWGDMGSFSQDAVSGAQVGTQVAPPTTIGTTSTTPFIPIATQTEGGAPAAFDMAAFLAALSQAPTKSTVSASNNVSVNTDAYTFIPSGVISTTSFAAAQRSAADQALYDYGNEAGSFIETYSDTHQNAPAILKAQIEDQQNPEKAQAVKDIGIALANVGKQLEGIESVPPAAQAVNTALAKAYEDIGAKLQKVPDAQRDADLVTAIETYDSAVNDFTKKYIAVVMMFSGLSIKFQSSDPGAVFTFSQSGGL